MDQKINADSLLFSQFEYKRGDSFPFTVVPSLDSVKPEGFNLSDFQWWAYTPDWDKWLKNNPRSWTAEGLSQTDGSQVLLEDFEPEKGRGILNFSEFDRIFEENESGDDEKKKRMTKLIFAWNRLEKGGEIKEEVDLRSLTVNSECGFWLDQPASDGSDSYESRDCFNLRVTGISDRYVIMESQATLFDGEFVKGEKVAPGWVSAVSAMEKFISSGAGTSILIYLGISQTISLLERMSGGSISKLRTAVSKWIPALAKSKKIPKAGWNLGTLWRSGKYVLTNLGGIRPFLFGSKFSKAGRQLKNINKGFLGNLFGKGKGFVKAVRAGRAAITGSRVAVGAAKYSNPIGWVILGAQAVQSYANWRGENQAPRYEDVEKEGWAHPEFNPASIKPGEYITICWTQEAGQNSVLGFAASLAVDNDTRTTMNLYKLGTFEGLGGENYEMFILAGVISEAVEKILQSSDLVIVSFPSGKKYGRSWHDNDDMDIMVSAIPKGGLAQFTEPFFFWGWCDWNTAKSAFDSAPDKFLDVPGSAPDQYEFNFKYGANAYDINVKGRLIPQDEIDTIEGVDKVFNSFGGDKSSEESNESFSFKNSPDIMSFGEYHSLKESTMVLEGDAIAVEDPPAEMSDKFGETLTEPAPLSAYVVEEVYYADNNLAELPKPELVTFVVGSESLQADVGQSITVGTIQDVNLKNPKRGIIDVESEVIPAPEVLPAGATGEGSDLSGGEGGVPITITRSEAVRRYEDYPEVLNKLGIKDRDKLKDKDLGDKKVVVLDAFTQDEKEELGISDWENIKKVVVIRDADTKSPLKIKFIGHNDSGNRKKVTFEDSDPRFTTAQKVADRVLSVQYVTKGEDSESDSDEDED